MEITREFLAQHKAELGQTLTQLRQQYANVQAQIYAAEGAIANCGWLQEHLAKAPPAEKSEIPKEPTVDSAPSSPPDAKTPDGVTNIAARRRCRSQPSPLPKT